MKHFYFEDKVLDSGVEIFINCSEEELQNYLRKKLDDKELNIKDGDRPDGLSFTLERDKVLKRIIWVKHFDWSVESQATLAHELIHFTLSVLKDKQIPISIDNTEIIAYYFEYFYNLIWDKLKPKKVYKRRKK